MDFNINYKKLKPVREENFNFKNSECQEIFKNILNTENNLVKCFENNDDLEHQVENWFKELNNIFYRSFRKMRVSNKLKETESSQLFEKRSQIIQKMKINQNKEELEDELEKVEAAIAKMVGKENHDKIYDTFKVLDQNEGENFAYEIWKSVFSVSLCPFS